MRLIAPFDSLPDHSSSHKFISPDSAKEYLAADARRNKFLVGINPAVLSISLQYKDHHPRLALRHESTKTLDTLVVAGKRRNKGWNYC